MKERALAALRGRRDVAPVESTVAPSTLAVLQALPLEWLVVGQGFHIEAASGHARSLGIADGGRLTERQLRGRVTTSLREGCISEAELDVGGESRGAPPRRIRVRVSSIGAQQAVLLIEDVTHPLRVDAMRRDFIVNVSHELKTPVGALLLLAEAVRSSTGDPETLNRFVDRMQMEAERLSRLINDVTDLSRLQASEPSLERREIPLPRLFAEAVDSVRLLAEKQHVDILIGECTGLTVVGDEDQLVTALRNLLTNAITYSSPNTRVTVTANLASEHVELIVSDQGIGIPDAEQERIFERFYRVDPARSRATGGTGLGLSIVKHIAAAHGGECVVWSQPGAGSTFTLRLRHGHFHAALSGTDSID